MRIKDVKAALLKKGWAGRTLSRKETVDRLNPIIRDHMALNHTYNYVIQHCGNESQANLLSDIQKTARMDIGKLMETVFSCGGVAYNGVDMEPEDFAPDTSDLLSALQEQETTFRDFLSAETAQEHQMRTRAVLQRLQRHSEDRLELLRTLKRQKRMR